jgi:FkbM family methyltransferase
VTGENDAPAAPPGDPAADTTECTLPDGRRIRCVSVAEAMVLCGEVTGEGLYRSAAEALRPGGTVLDIGANIGIVSLLLGAEVPDLRIIAVEPAPVTFACLEANLAAHLPRAVALRSAVCDQAGERKFTYYPKSTGNSGMFADRDSDDENTRIFMRNSGIAAEFIDEMVEGLHTGVEMTVPALTVSDLIRRFALREVSLLKVDVERAEHLVLAGIEAGHWPLIGRVVAEVHDDGERMKAITGLLEKHGFSVGVTQNPKFAGTELYELDARPRR